MSCCNYNNYNDGFDKARNIIIKTQKLNKSIGCCIPANSIIGPTGPTGAIGPTGPAGENGLSPNFSIGTVTTGNPGSLASVTIIQI